AFVASYDAGGAYRWAFQLPREGEGSSGLDIAHAPPSDLVVAGQFSLTTDFDPDPDEEVLLATACNEGSAFLARYADNGAPGGADLRWAFPLGGCVKDDFVPGITWQTGWPSPRRTRPSWRAPSGARPTSPPAPGRPSFPGLVMPSWRAMRGTAHTAGRSCSAAPTDTPSRGRWLHCRV